MFAKKEIYILGAIVILLIGGFVFLGVYLKSDSSSSGDLVSVAEISDFDWIKGDRGAKVVLIEYSDFQCPACAYYSGMVKQLTNDFGNQIAFVYRHFPLSQHKNAKLAAVAAEAAGKQGKFWEMHDMIFINQKEWAESSDALEIFSKYAGGIGINIAQFLADLKSKEIAEKVNNDYKGGTKAGVNATPTFFLGGKKISPQSYEEFKNIINEQLNNNF